MIDVEERRSETRTGLAHIQCMSLSFLFNESNAIYKAKSKKDLVKNKETLMEEIGKHPT